MFFMLTHATDNVMLAPPDAPATMTTSLSLSTTILGQVDDKGRFPAPGLLAFGHGYFEYDVFVKKSANSLL